MFSDKVLHRSKPEEPPLLTRVTVFASIMQSAAAAGGGGERLGGWGKGRGDGKGKGFVTRCRGRNENFSLKCIL